jgi:hypothetical protein
MKLRFGSDSIAFASVVGPLGVLGFVGVRLFAWLSSLIWASLALRSLPSLLNTDAVGKAWGAIWIVIFLVPSVVFFRHEMRLRRKA